VHKTSALRLAASTFVALCVLGAISQVRPFASTVSAANTQFGVNANLFWRGPDQAAADVERAHTAGLQSVRTDVQWDRLEPSAKSQWSADYLTYLDQVVRLITSRGMRPLLVVIGTPAWARANAGSRLTPPTNSQDYADTLGFLARRYAGQPGLAFEVWNEPNHPDFWDTPTGPDAAAYARLVRAAYPTIKAGDANATVVAGAIAYNDQTFLQNLYANGGITNSYDALSIHPYSGPYAPDSLGDGYQTFQGAIDQTIRTMSQYNEQAKPLWITEMGWRNTDVDEATRALYLRRAVVIARSYPQIAQFFAYTEDQADSADYGLITAAGNATGSWMGYGLEVALPNSSTSRMIGVIDSPQEWATVSGSLNVAGWAVDLGSPTGTGVDGVSVYVDGAAMAGAQYGTPRGDIGNAYGPRFANSGFAYQLDLSRLSAGYHMLEVRAHSTVSGGNSSFIRPLYVIPAPTRPVGAVDSPASNSSTVSPVHVAGWAADLAATGGATGVDHVRVFLDGTYVQDAAYGTPRPDIGAAYGPQFTNSGFSFDLNLPTVGTGPHTLSVHAHSVVTGADATYTTGFNLLRSIPVGAFDSVSDLAVVSGTLNLAGWAIDGGAPDGTGITAVRLYVDGTYAGDASIGAHRPDIAAGMGAQFTNSGYSMVIWTGGLANGWHVFDMRARSSLTGTDSSYAHPILVSN
jgi:hypothetical protein